MPTSLKPVEGHTGLALARLAHQYREQPQIGKLLRAFTEEADKLEDALILLLGARAIDTCRDTVLDRIGRIVGQPRNGIMDDDIYRAWLRVRLLINRSGGSGEDLLAICAGVPFGRGGELSEQGDLPPAMAIIRLRGAAATQEASMLRGALFEAKAAGVSLWFEHQPQDESETFTLLPELPEYSGKLLVLDGLPLAFPVKLGHAEKQIRVTGFPPNLPSKGVIVIEPGLAKEEIILVEEWDGSRFTLTHLPLLGHQNDSDIHWYSDIGLSDATNETRGGMLASMETLS